MLMVDASESSEIVNAASDFWTDGDDTMQSEGSVVESNVINEDFLPTKKEMHNQMLADGEVAQSNFTAVHNERNSDLLLGDSAGIMGLFLNASGSGAGNVVLKEENEMRKGRKKQSKRESSRKAKKVCKQEEVLQAVVKELKAESSKLEDELLSLYDKCSKLREENDCLVEELKQIYGADAVSSFEELISDTK